jgi:hypothetical protein
MEGPVKFKHPASAPCSNVQKAACMDMLQILVRMASKQSFMRLDGSTARGYLTMFS